MCVYMFVCVCVCVYICLCVFYKHFLLVDAMYLSSLIMPFEVQEYLILTKHNLFYFFLYLYLYFWITLFNAIQVTFLFKKKAEFFPLASINGAAVAKMFNPFVASD